MLIQPEAWINRLMPPVVTGSVVALIGLNLAPLSLVNSLNTSFVLSTPRDYGNLLIAAVTFVVAAGVSVYALGYSCGKSSGLGQMVA